MISWRIDLYSEAGALVQILDSDALRGVPEFSILRVVNGRGAFAMTMDANAPKLADVEQDGQVEFWWEDADLEIAWHKEFEGFIRLKRHHYSVKNGHKVTILGPGYNDLLFRTLVDAAAGSAAANKDGVAETVLKAYVNAEAGPGAGARARSGLTIEADGADGNDDHWSEPSKNLLDVCQRIARVGGGDFAIVGNGAAAFVLNWYDGQLGTDRRTSVTFSVERGNLDNVQWDEWGDDVNAVMVLGQGKHANRTRTWYTDAARIATTTWNRYELDRDCRDTDDSDVYQSRADESLELGRPKQNVHFEVAQLPGCAYGEHYFLGDLVTMHLGGTDYDKKLIAVGFKVDAAGTVMTPEWEDYQ